jgi:ribonuclease G
MRQILMDTHFLYKKTALIDNGSLEALAIEPLESEPMEGAIFLGKVTSVVTAMNAAFVDIGLKQAAYLHANDVYLKNGESLSELLKNGMELLVQLKSDSGRFKGPKVTAKLEITGKFLVLLPGSRQKAVSKRISDPVMRETLVTLAESVLGGLGYIVRTEAADADMARVLSEANRLKAVWETIERTYVTVKAPKCVYAGVTPSERLLLSQLEIPNTELVLGNLADLPALEAFMTLYDLQFDLTKVLHRHKRNPFLFEQYHLEYEVQALLARKVSLGGGYLLFDPTEAFLAIDVNAGGASSTTGNVSKVHKRVNQAAIKETLRQLELRNIGGMVLVDLIDAESEAEQRHYEVYCRKLLTERYPGIYFSGISALGILSLTRKRVGRPLYEILTETCECCGMGRKPSNASQLDRLLKEALKDGRGDQRYQVSEALFKVVEGQREILRQFEKDFDIHLEFEMVTLKTAAIDSFKKLL